MVKCAAGTLKTSLIVVTPAQLFSKWAGESEKNIRRIFICAKKMAPSIIFFDEIDKILPKEKHLEVWMSSIEAELLQQLDGIVSEMGFITIFASNDPWNINPALIRPGRIDKKIYVGPPDKETIMKIIVSQLSKIKAIKYSADSIKFLMSCLDRMTGHEYYYSHSAIMQIIAEIKRRLFEKYLYGKTDVVLTEEIILDAVEKIPPDIPKTLIMKYMNWSKSVRL